MATHDPHAPFSTTESGARRASDAQSLSVGRDGPLLLSDVELVQKLARFDRERIPERSPHAKGSGAFGELEITEDISEFTSADFLQKGRKTPMLARFSTVAGELGSPDTWRDVRGFALRFYTNEGNQDIVGNNTPVFFIRDPMKFPDFIHSQKREPDTGLRSNNMQWDFWSLSPESAHQVAYLMGGRGIPRTWRNMNGYSSHTYSLINKDGKITWVRWHFHADAGVENLTNAEATELAGTDADFHRRDLFEHIAKGEFPSWRVSLQLIPYDDAKDYRFNIFDLTKVVSKKDYPLVDIGRFTLNRNPVNHFAEIEEAAFSPSNMVPGTGISPDKMLMARVFSYPDAQRNRIGTNYNQLPVNQPIDAVRVNSYDKEGQMEFFHSGDAPVYAPNSYGRAYQDQETREGWGNLWSSDEELMRAAYTLHSEDDDFGQAHTLVRDVYTDQERADLVDTVVGMLKDGVKEPVLTNTFQYWKNIDAEVGAAIESKYRGGSENAGDHVPGAGAVSSEEAPEGKTE